ncbi:MAG: radical SAM/SPASM domain-containing protein, partial [Candidatus Thorarchaeota archaeon]
MNSDDIKDGLRIICSYYFGSSPRLRHITLSITSKCNLNCVMCEARTLYKPQVEMPFWMVKKIIDEGEELGLKKVLLGATGEPTIHVDFIKIVDYVKSKGLFANTVTNLAHVNDKIIGALGKLDVINVSMDAASKTTYEKIRRGARWEETIENLKKLVKTDAKVLINYVVQKGNYMEMSRAVDFYMGLGVDGISFGGLTNIDPEVKYLQLDERDFDDYVKEARATVKALEKHKLPIPVFIRPDLLCQYKEEFLSKGYSPYLRIGFDPMKTPCYVLWFSLHVAPDGKVYPCCVWEYARRTAIPLGEMNKQSLTEIWNSDKMKDMRHLLLKKRYSVC